MILSIYFDKECDKDIQKFIKYICLSWLGPRNRGVGKNKRKWSFEHCLKNIRNPQVRIFFHFFHRSGNTDFITLTW